MQDLTEFALRERSGWSDPAVVAGYGTNLEPLTDEVGAVIAARLGRPRRRVLDLCCGRGDLAARLSGLGAEVVGLDFSAEMLARARVRVPGVRFVRGDAAALPMGDAAFDAVACNFGMPHLPDPPAGLAQVRRVLRPGGTFAASCWLGPERSPAFGAVLTGIREHADLTRLPPQPDFFALSRPETAEQMLAAAGLRLQRHEVLTPVLRLASPHALFDVFANATVGIAMLLRSQEPAALARIRERMAAIVEETCRDDGGRRVPMPAALVTAAA